MKVNTKKNRELVRAAIVEAGAYYEDTTGPIGDRLRQCADAQMPGGEFDYTDDDRDLFRRAAEIADRVGYSHVQ